MLEDIDGLDGEDFNRKAGVILFKIIEQTFKDKLSFTRVQEDTSDPGTVTFTYNEQWFKKNKFAPILDETVGNMFEFYYQC